MAVLNTNTESAKKLTQRREEILDSLQLTSSEYGYKMRSNTLNATETDALLEYNTISFLLNL